ncbi:MAG TPA: class I SAM-dependent methyltransferase [Tepidisphaeraceae bacterium]|nr:class I SAM-dependent methyltransferase [Tepidisphaeraceae bacterium]
MIQKMFRVVSDRSRRRKIQMFYDIMRPRAGTRILDVGGEAGDAAGNTIQPNKQLIDSYPTKSNITLINLFFPDVQRAQKAVPELKTVCGSGLQLPFADKSFDICYCNAVIEHVFNFENQHLFAREIMRVAKSWFVTTPNRWFPFEPHLRLPLVTWLPQGVQHKIGYKFGYLHIKKKYGSGADRTDICLLSRRKLKQLFPTSRVVRNGVPGFTPTFIAYGGEILDQQGASLPADGDFLRPIAAA